MPKLFFTNFLSEHSLPDWVNPITHRLQFLTSGHSGAQAFCLLTHAYDPRCLFCKAHWRNDNYTPARQKNERQWVVGGGVGRRSGVRAKRQCVKYNLKSHRRWNNMSRVNLYGYVGDNISWKFTAACCLAVGLWLGLEVDLLMLVYSS